MKRGWLAAVLLVLMAALAAWHVLTINALAGELSGALAEAETLAQAGRWEEAAQATRTAEAVWESRSFYLHTTLDHAVVDQVSVGFAETLSCLEREDPGEYAAASAALRRRLRLLGEMETPTLENLL